LEQIIEDPPHFRESSQSLIDLVFASNKNTNIKSGVREHIFINRVTVFQNLVFLVSETKKHTLWKKIVMIYENIEMNFTIFNETNALISISTNRLLKTFSPNYSYL
jgi:hypothetical protein